MSLVPISFVRFIILLVPAFLASLSTALGSGCGSKTAETLVIALDVGHLAKKPGQECQLGVACPWGATSARGVPEYDFNLKLATAIKEELDRGGFRAVHLLVPAPDSSLQERVARARALNADFFISVHHDGVRDEFLKSWTFDGRRNWYYDGSNGFSLHVSPRNASYRDSLGLARAIADQLMAGGLHFSTAHEPSNPVGARAPWLDRTRGIYRRDGLVVLATSAMPAVLLEGGTIVNRQEELEVSTPAYRSQVATAVATAVSQFCGFGASAAPPSPAVATWRVTGVASDDVLNMRSGPGANEGVVGTIPPDGRGVRMVGTCTGQWCRVSYQDATGWVNRRFLAAE
jgi:N-acetylmuramoyl-L-alanine amidase